MPDVRYLAPHVSRSLTTIVRKATAPKPAERYASASEFDSALGDLPAVTWEYERVDPHPGHDRCWSAVRAHDGHEVDVCVLPRKTSGFDVEVRHRASRNRLKHLCGSAAKEPALASLLRTTFEGLRKV